MIEYPSPIEDVVNLLPDVRSQAQELAVDSMQSGLEEVPLSWVLAVKQIQQLNHKSLIDVLLGNGRLELLGLQEPEEKLVDNLQMWPAGFESGLVLLGVKLLPTGIGGGGQSSESIDGKLGRRRK